MAAFLYLGIMRVMQEFDWCLRFGFVVCKADHPTPRDKK